ncbi:MAG: antitoxin TumA [bacterium]
MMKKQIITYDSPVDALIALSKRLNNYESQYRMSSEIFFDKFNKGDLDDRIDFIEWANDYEIFHEIKMKIENALEHVATT